jgi:hypothetical protein
VSILFKKNSTQKAMAARVELIAPTLRERQWHKEIERQRLPFDQVPAYRKNLGVDPPARDEDAKVEEVDEDGIVSSQPDRVSDVESPIPRPVQVPAAFNKNNEALRDPRTDVDERVFEAIADLWRVAHVSTDSLKYVFTHADQALAEFDSLDMVRRRTNERIQRARGLLTKPTSLLEEEDCRLLFSSLIFGDDTEFGYALSYIDVLLEYGLEEHPMREIIRKMTRIDLEHPHKQSMSKIVSSWFQYFVAGIFLKLDAIDQRQVNIWMEKLFAAYDESDNDNEQGDFREAVKKFETFKKYKEFFDAMQSLRQEAGQQPERQLEYMLGRIDPELTKLDDDLQQMVQSRVAAIRSKISELPRDQKHLMAVPMLLIFQEEYNFNQWLRGLSNAFKYQITTPAVAQWFVSDLDEPGKSEKSGIVARWFQEVDTVFAQQELNKKKSLLESLQILGTAYDDDDDEEFDKVITDLEGQLGPLPLRAAGRDRHVSTASDASDAHAAYKAVLLSVMRHLARSFDKRDLAAAAERMMRKPSLAALAPLVNPTRRRQAVADLRRLDQHVKQFPISKGLSTLVKHAGKPSFSAKFSKYKK